MTTHSSTWKRFEREVARYFGSERTPLSGMSDNLTKADSLHPTLFIEAKLRGELPLWDYITALPTKAARVGELLVIHSSRIRLDTGRLPVSKKYSALFTLFSSVEPKAAKEEKIPVVVYKKKGKVGWLLVCKPEHLTQIRACIV